MALPTSQRLFSEAFKVVLAPGLENKAAVTTPIHKLSA